MNLIRTSLRALAGPWVLALLAACSSPEAPPAAPPAAPPKPVKVERVAAGADAGSDSFIGTARARQRTELGFETSGRVASVLVDVGSHVKAGQTLASLDDQPARLRLNRAEADLSAALAVRAERRNALRQHESLARQQMISSAALQGVQASEAQASGQADAAEAAVRAARRELALSRITAPFDGEIVARAAQPHADVGAGQAVLTLESGHELEVLAMLPERLATGLKPGDAASGSAGGESLRLLLKSVSARADNGSLVQAIFRIDGRPAALRSGSVVSLELRRPVQGAAGVSLPVSALMPGAVAGQGSVYVVDAASGTLARRAVRIDPATLLPGGRVALTQGLRAGDQVVVAGTAFLAEGQRVVVHAPQTVLQEQRP